MKQEIEQNKESIILRITIPVYSNIDYPTKVKVSDSDARKILESKNIKVGKILSGPGVLTNFRNSTQLSAEWAFEVLPTATPRDNIRLSNSVNNKKRSRKSKKTLDKSSQNVIIEEDNTSSQ
jgi:hypothetical protein